MSGPLVTTCFRDAPGARVKAASCTLACQPRGTSGILITTCVSRSLKGFSVPPTDDFLESRKTVLYNSDCHIVLASPKKSLTAYFYKNTDEDELIFIHKGKGKLRTMLGNLDFKYGDYLLIPRGIIYKIDFN